MPLSACNSILKGTTIKEFINSFADSSFNEYLKENDLIPESVRLPAPIDMIPTPKECLSRKRKVIDGLEGELHKMEATPVEQLIAVVKEEHDRIISTNHLSEENRTKYMSMLDKISTWETNSPTLIKMKEKILKCIRESMIVDRYDLDVYYLIGYYKSVPAILTKSGALSRIRKKKNDLLRSCLKMGN